MSCDRDWTCHACIWRWKRIRSQGTSATSESGRDKSTDPHLEPSERITALWTPQILAQWNPIWDSDFQMYKIIKSCYLTRKFVATCYSNCRNLIYEAHKCLCASPCKIHIWNPNPQCNSIRRWGLWEVTRPWGWYPNKWDECPHKSDPRESVHLHLGLPTSRIVEISACYLQAIQPGVFMVGSGWTKIGITMASLPPLQSGGRNQVRRAVEGLGKL